MNKGWMDDIFHNFPELEKSFISVFQRVCRSALSMNVYMLQFSTEVMWVRAFWCTNSKIIRLKTLENKLMHSKKQ